MMKNKTKLIITSVIILLPVVAGLILWGRLPEQMDTHWDARGVANGSSPRAFAVFGLPLILLALHWICIFVSDRDTGNRGQSLKVFGIVFWICPVLSIFSGGVIYMSALGRTLKVAALAFLLIGAMFAVIGNYLPKCKRNRTIGIKVKWALADDENWNATHRFGGKVWAIGGVLIMICAFLPASVASWALAWILVTIAVLPALYSFLYSRK